MSGEQTLLDLAARCEAATGPDRELDAEIAAVVHVKQLTYQPGDWLKDPDYTASLDAAMTLVPEGLKWGIGSPQDGYSYATMGNVSRAIRAATPALALTAAALRAIAHQMRIKDND